MPEETRFRGLLDTLADRPRWVEARGLLLSGRCEVIHGPEGRTTGGYVVLEHGRLQAIAVERPVRAIIEELLGEHPEYTELLAPIEHSEHLGSLLPGWVARPATIHVHPDPASLPGPEHEVRWLRPENAQELDHLPLHLAHEIALAAETCPTVATYVDEKPLAFCYAAYETETWWDISVDTIEPHRRRRLASSAASFLIHQMLATGKQPVWGALDANRASLAMAAKYGFRAVDRMVVLTAPEG